MNLEDHWRRLERGEGQSAEPDIVVRRVDPDFRDDLFIGIRHPAKTRLLLLQVDIAPRLTPESLIQSRGFRTEIKSFANLPRTFNLCIEALDPRFNELFGVVANDVIRELTLRPLPTSAVTALLGRLRFWKLFFDAAGPVGLNAEAVLGLFGELLFLRDFSLRECTNAITAIASWSGPDLLSKDFESSSCCVEVKCALSREHAKVRINGERQMDDSGFPAFFLFVVLAERVTGNGLSLPQLISDIRSRLAECTASSTFENKLISAGYHDLHEQQYVQQLLLVRQCRAFRVRSGFPRIGPTLPSGVGDVGYTIALSACQPFEVQLNEVRELLRRVEPYDA